MSSPAPTVRDQRREQILAAATEVFAANGVEATRVQDVAAAAGVAYGLVYHYFGSKQGLLQQVFDDAWSAFGDALEGIAASPRPAPDKVRAALDYVLGAWSHRPALLQVVVHAATRADALSDPRAHPLVGRALTALEGLYAAGPLAAGVDPAVLTRLLLGALEAATATADLTRPPPPALRSTLLRLFRDAPFESPAPEVPCTSS